MKVCTLLLATLLVGCRITEPLCPEVILPEFPRSVVATVSASGGYVEALGSSTVLCEVRDGKQVPLGTSPKGVADYNSDSLFAYFAVKRDSTFSRAGLSLADSDSIGLYFHIAEVLSADNIFAPNLCYRGLAGGGWQAVDTLCGRLTDNVWATAYYPYQASGDSALFFKHCVSVDQRVDRAYRQSNLLSAVGVAVVSPAERPQVSLAFAPRMAKFSLVFTVPSTVETLAVDSVVSVRFLNFATSCLVALPTGAVSSAGSVCGVVPRSVLSTGKAGTLARYEAVVAPQTLAKGTELAEVVLRLVDGAEHRLLYAIPLSSDDLVLVSGRQYLFSVGGSGSVLPPAPVPTLELSPVFWSVPKTAEVDFPVSVVTQAGVRWKAVVALGGDWLTIHSEDLGEHSGSGTFRLSALASDVDTVRTGVVCVEFGDGQYGYLSRFEVTQAPMVIASSPINPPSANDYVEIYGLKWAKGNLVAKNDNECVVGAPTDCGVYFQFGSLVGWAGGATGNGVGAGNPALDKAVWPLTMGEAKPNHNFMFADGVNINTLTSFYFNYSIAPWNTSPTPADTYTTNRTDIGKFGVTVSGQVSATGTLRSGRYANLGVGDPCTYYLGAPWRTPATYEYPILIGNYTANAVYNSYSLDFIHYDLSFPYAGARGYYLGQCFDIGRLPYYWSSSFLGNKSGGCMHLRSRGSTGHYYYDRALAMPIRCVSGVYTEPLSAIIEYGVEPYNVTTGLSGSTTVSYNAWRGEVASPGVNGGNGEYYANATDILSEKPYYKFEVALADEAASPTWAAARQTCWDKAPAGAWRLPRIVELTLVFSHKHTLELMRYFNALPDHRYYWSATENNASRAWYMHVGGTEPYKPSITPKANNPSLKTRCVREVP